MISPLGHEGRPAASLLSAFLAPYLVVVIWGAVTSYHPNYGFNEMLFMYFVLFGFVITASHVVFLGVPVFVYLARRFEIWLWTTALVSFILGGLPFAILFHPAMRGSNVNLSARHGHDGIAYESYSGGVPTAHAWADYFYFLGLFGGLGALGGVAFWATWKYLSRNDTR